MRIAVVEVLGALIRELAGTEDAAAAAKQIAGLFDHLLGPGNLGLQQLPLPVRLELVAVEVGLGGIDRGLRLPDQGTLDIFLIAEIGLRRLSRG